MVKEKEHVNNALKTCGYPSWSFKRVKDSRDCQKDKKKERKDKRDNTDRPIQVTMPYVQGVSEVLQRVLKRFGVSAALKPHLTLKRLLVHPKDKRVPQDTAGVVYEIPCKDCDKVYVGETGRRYGTREKEHQKDVKSAR